MKRALFGTAAYHPHAQHIARALHEAGALYAYATCGVDVFHNPVVQAIRRGAGAIIPAVDREMGRRTVTSVPHNLVRSRWRWELPRAVASRLSLDARVVDWLWETGERDLDRACARLVAREEVDAFLGVEFGALAAIQAAKILNKPAMVAFLSPHHRTFAKWVAAEYERFPELAGRHEQYFAPRTAARDARRDQEAELADAIVSNSTFTTQSLVDAGIPSEKLLTVPLGGPAPVDRRALPSERPTIVKFMYAGPVSVRKGAHYLLRAWKRAAHQNLELHFYGSNLLPERVLREAEAARGGSAIRFHGSVTPAELSRAYLESSVLVLPTLCDGFGMVVSEALAHGLPVITTRNAGAADAVVHGRTGLIIPAADEDALADAITWCAEHPADLFDMRDAALNAASQWTWADFRRRLREQISGPLSHSPAVTLSPIPMGLAG